MLVDHVHAALVQVYDHGVRVGESKRREAALREMLCIARGLEQDARSRVQVLERELAEHLNTLGKVTT